MKKVFIVSVLVCCLSVAVSAQETPTGFVVPAASVQQAAAYNGGFLANYGVGIKTGLYGLGADFYTSLHPNIKVRVGANIFPLNYTAGLDFEASGYVSGNDFMVSVDKAELRFIHANLLVDFFPMRSGIFHFTAGLYFGQSKIAVYGRAPEEFEVGDYLIKPDLAGKFGATLKLGNVMKPYLGFGLGRTITKRRVGFKFEMGVVYQGSYKIESRNVDTSAIMEEINSLDFPKIFTELWPMMTFSLSYRIR